LSYSGKQERLGRRAAKHLKGERQRNEAEITAFVDQLIEDELLRISEKRLPPEKTLVKYRAIFRDFAEWARANGVDALPAAGAVIFFWLTHDSAPEKVSQRIRALRFAHDVSREYFDESYVAAAERWARIVKPKQKEASNGKQ